jgi:chaperonin cofactor prefoldin
MRTDELIVELDEAIKNLKIRIIYLQTENNNLRKRIAELKKCVREK